MKVFIVEIIHRAAIAAHDESEAYDIASDRVRDIVSDAVEPDDLQVTRSLRSVEEADRLGFNPSIYPYVGDDTDDRTIAQILENP